MTEQQFKSFIRKPDKIDDVINYIICISAILGGLFFLSIQLEIFETRPKHDADYFAATILLSIGIYGLWRIPKDYIITTINSNRTLDEKREIVESYLLTLNVRRRFVSGELYRIQYRNKFYNSVDLSIAYDEKQFFISAKGADISGGKGIIDFGLTRRAAKKASTYFGEKASL